MKKTYIQYDENRAFASLHDGNEEFALYVGVDNVYGEWIAETSGDPMSLNALEELDNGEEMIRSIDAIINDPTTAWEELSKSDNEYVIDTLAAWGL